MSKHSFSILFITVFAALTTVTAYAQYVWLDDKGGKQFSDLPPPVSIPKSRILKSPSRNNVDNTSSTKEQSSITGSVNEALPNEKLQKPVTTANKNEDFNKRKAEQEEKEKKATTEKQASTEKAKNCERARAYQQSLQSGVRIAHTDKNGERAFISDAQREQELADVKRSLSECK
ncbi:hypothetical protein BH11PSE12_BH11PSE12_16800 [soil metagenome]